MKQKENIKQIHGQNAAHWFAIFYNYEAESDYDEGHVNLGVIDCELSVWEELSGSYDVTIELAE